MAIGVFLSLFGIETRGELRLRMPEPVRFGSRPRFSRSTSQGYSLWIRRYATELSYRFQRLRFRKVEQRSQY